MHAIRSGLHQRLGWIAALAASLLVVSGASASHGLLLKTSLPPEAVPTEIKVRATEVVTGRGGTEPRQQLFSLASPGTLEVPLDEGGVWRFTIESEGYWAADSIVTVGGPEAGLLLHVWPTATLTGRLAVDEGEDMPSSTRLRFETSPGAHPAIERAEVECGTTEGVFRCQVPAGALDLRLRARGFVSHYYWDLALAPKAHREKSLGTIELERGGSIVGFVLKDDESTPFDESVVRLTRAHTDVTAVDRAPLREAKVNPRGFFELVGLVEGLYAVSVTHPGHARARFAPIEVRTNAETELVPSIRLHHPLALDVTLRPERVDKERPWRLELLRQGEVPGYLEQIASGTAAEDGTWLRAGLDPGEYRLRVDSESGPDLPDAVWHSRVIELHPGTGTTSVLIDLPSEELSGQIYLGENPVAAKVYFGAYSGSLRIPTWSDDEGRFSLRVPYHETWTVDVYSRSPKAGKRFVEVRPEPDGGGGRYVELVIPDTRIKGRVLDEQGEGVEGAEVSASGKGGRTVFAEQKGRFELRGLSPGEYWLEATSTDPSGTSVVHGVEVGEEGLLEEIELVVLPRRTLEGAVLDPTGNGVVGAHVYGLIEQEKQRLDRVVPEAVTDVDGIFSLELPAAAQGVQLTFMAPGFALRQRRVDAQLENPLIVQVQPIGGTLDIHLGEGMRLDDVAIFKDYLLPDPGALRDWARINGHDNVGKNRLAVPSVEPGSYWLCPFPAFKVSAHGRLRPELVKQCEGGHLAPGGKLELFLALSP